MFASSLGHAAGASLTSLSAPRRTTVRSGGGVRSSGVLASAASTPPSGAGAIHFTRSTSAGKASITSTSSRGSRSAVIAASAASSSAAAVAAAASTAGPASAAATATTANAALPQVAAAAMTISELTMGNALATIPYACMWQGRGGGEG